MFERLQHILNTAQTHWSADPAARGAAKMTAGAILVVEGVFGAIRGGRKGGGGLLGGILGVGAGAMFMWLGSWMTPGYEDAVLVEGRIVDVREGESDGRAAYSAVFKYQANGADYEFVSSMSSSSRPTIGEVVQIAYSAQEPRNAYRADGIDGNFHLIFLGVGALIALLASLNLLVSLGLLAFGTWVFLQGRRDRRAAGVSQGFFTDLLALAGQARSGEVRIEDTAVGIAGPMQGR